MTFDPTKPVQFRDGSAARIICTDNNTALRREELVFSIAVAMKIHARTGLRRPHPRHRRADTERAVVEELRAWNKKFANAFDDGFKAGKNYLADYTKHKEGRK